MFLLQTAPELLIFVLKYTKANRKSGIHSTPLKSPTISESANCLDQIGAELLTRNEYGQQVFAEKIK